MLIADAIINHDFWEGGSEAGGVGEVKRLNHPSICITITTMKALWPIPHIQAENGCNGLWNVTNEYKIATVGNNKSARRCQAHAGSWRLESKALVLADN